MIAIVDYDAGNIKSVTGALRYLGADACLTRDPGTILGAEKVILPGVGSFGDAMEKLDRYGLTGPVRKAALSGKPFIGICLGLQLLFEDSEESPGVPGLGILPGHVLRFSKKEGFKIPQIGWNDLQIRRDSRLFSGIPDGSYVYFVHSYYVKADDPAVVAAKTVYSDTADAAVERGNLFGCQFHPEKSGDVGLSILKNFISIPEGPC